MRFAVLAALCAMLTGLVGCSGEKAEKAAFEGKVVTTLEEALSAAKSENRPVLVVAYQGSPDMIDRNLLSDAALKERDSKFITAKLDAATQSAALSQLQVTAYPTMLVLKPDGSVAWRAQGMVFPGQVALAIDQATK